MRNFSVWSLEGVRIMEPIIVEFVVRRSFEDRCTAPAVAYVAPLPFQRLTPIAGTTWLLLQSVNMIASSNTAVRISVHIRRTVWTRAKLDVLKTCAVLRRLVGSLLCKGRPVRQVALPCTPRRRLVFPEGKVSRIQKRESPF
jgi:hypothetical protein